LSLDLVFLPEAQEEFDEAVDWYQGQRAGLGDEFIDSVDDTPLIGRLAGEAGAGMASSSQRCAIRSSVPVVVYLPRRTPSPPPVAERFTRSAGSWPDRT
jgi:hypothetical protein